MSKDVKSPYEESCKKAFDYAKTILKSGYTWGDHADYKEDKWIAKPGYEKVFEKNKKAVKAIRKNPYDKFLKDNLMEEDDLGAFEEKIARTCKFSLGNCYEFAILAFYYCLIKGIPAEVYTVTNDDHAFVVINRPPGSNPEDPKTWGKETLISDPWDNHWYYVQDLDERFTKVFSKDFKVAPLRKDLNTKNLSLHRTLKDLEINFLKKCELISIQLKICLKKFQSLLKTSSSVKHPIIQKKIEEITAILSILIRAKEIFELLKNTAKKKESSNWMDHYSLTRHSLQREFSLLRKQALSAVTLSKEDSENLYAHVAETSKGKLMRFFSIPCGSEWRLKDTLEEARQEIQAACQYSSYISDYREISFSI